VRNVTLHWSQIDWSATGEMLGAIVAAIFGVTGFVLSLIGIKTGRRSERIAADAARSAEESAREAKRVADIETAREHRDLDPAPTATFRVERSPTVQDAFNLWAEITVSHTCRIAGDVVMSQGIHRLAVPVLMAAGVPERVRVELMRDGQGEPQVTELRLRMWPPADSDDVEHWSCPCPRPIGQEGGGPGHWERTLPVRDIKRPPPPPMMARR
jgi:hypothetical protein